MALLKIIVMLAVLFLLALPYLPLQIPLTICWFNFEKKERPKNFIYLFALAILTIVLIALLPTLLNIVDWFMGLGPVSWLLNKIPNYIEYDINLIETIGANILYGLIVLVVLGLVRGTYNPIHALLLKIKAFFAHLKEKWNEKHKKKGHKGQKGQQKGSKGQNTSAKKSGNLPPELLPEPQKETNLDRILIKGDTTVIASGKGAAAKTAAKPKQNRKDHSDKDEDGFKLSSITQALLKLVYVPDEEDPDNGWFATSQGRKNAKLLRNFLILCGIGYLLMFLLLMLPMFFKLDASWFYSAASFLIKVSYFYPAVAMTFLTELFWCLNGSASGWESHFQQVQNILRTKGRMVDLNAIESDLLKAYGDQYEVRSFRSDSLNLDDQDFDIVLPEQKAAVQIVSSYVTRQGYKVNNRYLEGILNLDKGCHVLFDAPIYTSAGLYIYSYLNLRISRGEHVVVVCWNSKEIEALKENLESGLIKATHTHKNIWSIRDRETFRQEQRTDVLILTPDEFSDDRLYNEISDFLKNVSIVLMPDADQVIYSNNYYCLVMSHRLQQLSNYRIQYLFMTTRHRLNLGNSLTQYFCLDTGVKAVSNDYGFGEIRLYVWRAKGAGRAILDNSAQNVRLEAKIAQIANRRGVAEINVISNGAIYDNQVVQEWFKPQNSAETVVGFTVVADDRFNLPGVIYAYSRYIGRKASVLHVISQPYMLRDFFYDQAPRYLFEQPVLEQGMTEHAEKRKSRMILLLCRLIEGIPVAEFVVEMAALGVACENVNASDPTRADLNRLTAVCLEEVLGKAPEGEDYYNRFTLETVHTPDFAPVKKIIIRENNILARLLADTALVQLHFTGGRSPVPVNLFRKMMNQRYVIGQNLVYDHKNYVVKKLDLDKGIVYVDDTNEVHDVPSDYVHIRKYTLKNDNGLSAMARKEAGDTEQTAGTDYVHIRRHDLNVFGQETPIDHLTMISSQGGTVLESETEAYYLIPEDTEGLDIFHNTLFYRVLSAAERKPLQHDTDRVLYFRLSGDSYEQNDRITMTFAALLQEMLKTLFPDNYFCVSVCPILNDPDEIYRNDDKASAKIASMYSHVDGWKSAQDHAIEVFLIDDCPGGCGIFDLLYEGDMVYIRNIIGMMYDYLKWVSEGDRKPYIWFGADTMPAIYDLSGLQEALKGLRREYIRQHDIFTKLNTSDGCCFCLDKLNNGTSYLWQDREGMCEHCAKEYIPSIDESQKILEYALQFLKDRFNVTLDNVTVAEADEFECAESFSTLSLSDNQIHLAPELPVNAVHYEIISQLVRIWQNQNLDMDGRDELEGQVAYVALQYLQFLKQYQTRKRRMAAYQLGNDSVSNGFRILYQAMIQRNDDNTFTFMLEQKKAVPPPPPPPVPKPIDPKKKKRKLDGTKPEGWYYRLLNDQQKQFYEDLCAAIENMEKDCPMAGAATEDCEKVYSSVEGDHPEYYWVIWRGWSYTGGQFRINYNMSADERQKRQAEIDQATGEFVRELTSDMSDYEVALNLYKRMAEILEYDSIKLDEQERKDYDGTPDDLRSIYGGFVEHRCVCAGYAKCYQYLLQKAGIEALYVKGYCKTGGYHAWNIINLEGEYYHVDTTWGDRSNTDPHRNGQGMSYDYFGLTDEEICRSRNIDAKPEKPKCTSQQCNYYLREGLMFSTYNGKAMMDALVKQIQAGQKDVGICFTTLNARDYAYQQLSRNGGIYEACRKAGKKVSGAVYTYCSGQYIYSIVFHIPE